MFSFLPPMYSWSVCGVARNPVATQATVGHSWKHSPEFEIWFQILWYKYILDCLGREYHEGMKMELHPCDEET